MSKKRDRSEISGGDNFNNYDENLISESIMLECEENEYKACNIIDGYNVHVQNFTDNCDFEVSLRQINPDLIILYEPYLEFMRAIEIYNAERILISNKKYPIEVQLLLYEESSELY